MKVNILIVFVFLYFTCCSERKKDERSYFDIEKISIVPASIEIIDSTEVLKYKRNFDTNIERVPIVFFIQGLNFLDEYGNVINSDIPNAGSDGSYSKVKSVRISIENELNKNYKDISNEIILDTSKRNKLLFLTQDAADRFKDSLIKGIHLNGVKTLASFESLSKIINEKDRNYFYRNLMRGDLRPYIIFYVPSNLLISAKNTIKVEIQTDNNLISTTADFFWNHIE